MTTCNRLLKQQYLANMRVAAMCYREELITAKYDGNWNDRIHSALYWLSCAKFWRRHAGYIK